MRKIIGTALGKSVRGLTKLRGSGGQALPGLVVERLLPGYLVAMLEQLPRGVVIITGTNGKTTTTKIVVELLRAQGLRVLTNPTGSNFTRGITASLTQQARLSGHLPFDIGVFELDEAYATHFVAKIKPRWVLALNVMRDQLDRFGELDTAAKMVGACMHAATEGVVTNCDDARLAGIAQDIASKRKVRFFGVAPNLRHHFPTDDEIVATKSTAKPARRTCQAELTAFAPGQATFNIDGKPTSVAVQLSGQHNFQNAAAALALATALLPDIEPMAIAARLADVGPAFGRGQRFRLKNGSHLELILIKNPAGFRQTLASYPVRTRAVMVAINDNYADGRDTSWLWDVDFSKLKGCKVALTSGTRAADMALRLHYDGVGVHKIEPQLRTALADFCKIPGDKLLITTYTAMLRFYKMLQKDAGKTL